MKKIKISGIIVCFLLLLTGIRVGAAGDGVVDRAGLLTPDQEEKLEERLAEIVEEYDCDVAIVTTESTGGLSPRTYADNYYEQNGYGVGPDHDGLLLLISMEKRDWWITTWGSAIDTFTDYGIQKIGEMIVDMLRDADYYGAFRKYADLTEEFLRQDGKGEPFDVSNEYKAPFPFGAKLAIACGIGLVAALITFFSLRAQLRTVSYKKEAHSYVRPGSFHLTRSNDLYLYRTVMRTKIERPSPSGSGGNSGGGSHVHTTSGGGRAGGGGGKF